MCLDSKLHRLKPNGNKLVRHNILGNKLVPRISYFTHPFFELHIVYCILNQNMKSPAKPNGKMDNRGVIHDQYINFLLEVRWMSCALNGLCTTL